MLHYFRIIVFATFLASTILSCSKHNDRPKPLAFDASTSDPAAVELADSVINAAGGQRAWNENRYFSWTTYAGRQIFWDKEKERVRLESDGNVYLLNLSDTTARTLSPGSNSKTDGLTALSIFTEESRNLLLPFLLKQHGARLVYLGEDSLADGTRVNILTLSHGDIQSKLAVHVGVADNLIKNTIHGDWADSIKANHAWDNYKKFKNLYLSTDRSNGAGPTKLSLAPIEEERFEKF